MLSSMLGRVVGGCNSHSDKYLEYCIRECSGRRGIAKLIAIRASRRASWAQNTFVRECETAVQSFREESRLPVSRENF